MDPMGSFFNPDPLLVLIGLTMSLFMGMYQLWMAGKDAEKQRKRREYKWKGEKAEERLKKHSENQFGEKKLVKVDGGRLRCHGMRSLQLCPH